MQQLVCRIIEAMSPAGGVTPKNRGPKTVQNSILRNGSEQAFAAVQLAVDALKTCAISVGLQITVNDLARLTGLLASRYQDALQGTASLLPPLYKGVSYNPAGKGWREWVVLLDFFALMRQFAGQFGKHKFLGASPQIAVLDASLYWMVNLLGEEGIVLTAKDPDAAARELLGFLMQRVAKREPNEEMYEIALMRNSYMRAIAELFPARCAPPVFSVMDVWRDPGFAGFLSTALANFCAYQGGRWRVARAVDYQRYMKYSPWVTPLVVAEQTFLAAKSGFRLFLAPVQEAAWNQAVDLMSRITGTPRYAVFMYDRPKTADIAYGEFPFFSDSPRQLADKFSAQPSLLPVVAGFVSAFLAAERAEKLNEVIRQSDMVAASAIIGDFIARIDERAKQLASGGSVGMPLDNLGWLMQFPPGTC